MPKSPNKRITITTPAGTLRFGWIDRPGKKYKTEGLTLDQQEYSATVVLQPGKETTEFCKRLTALAEEARAKFVEEAKAEKDPKVRKKISGRAKYKLLTGFVQDEDEEGEPTEAFVVKAKTGAGRKEKQPDGSFKLVARTIPIFDGKANPAKGVRIGRGSTVRVSCQVQPFVMDDQEKVGITLYLEAVQVIELVPVGGGGNAKSYGFEAADDGFDASEVEPDESAPFEASESESGEPVDENGDF